MLAFNTKPVPHSEARDIIAGKPAVTREVFDSMPDEIRALAFTVTGIEDFDTLQAIRDRIADLPAGANWDEVKKDIVADLSPWFSEEAANRRAQILMRHHGFSAYASAQARVMDELIDVFPYRQYISTEDSRVRASHAALNGIIIRADHAFWEKHTPPWEWNCRCDVVELTGEDMEEERGKDAGRPPHLRRVLEGPALRQLDQGQINRGPQTNVDIRTPRERGGTYENNVRQHGVPYHQIRDRWDKPTREAFETWAGKQALASGTLLDHLLGRKVTKKPKAKARKSVVRKSATVASMIKDLKPLASEVESIDKRLEETRADMKAIYDELSRGDVNQQKLAKLDNARAKVRLLNEEKQQVIEKARALVEIPAEQRGKVKLTGTHTRQGKQRKTSAPVMKAARQGAAITERYTHKDLLPDITVKARAGRAYYHPAEKAIYISSKSGASVAAHEISHGTEIQNKTVLDKSNKFLKARAGGRSPRPLRSLTGHNYGRDERAFEDDWAKLGGHPYTGKDYHGTATELLSMGIERLHRDPATFASSDPGYFEFIITTLQKR